MSTSTNAPPSYKLRKTTTSPCVEHECTSGRRNRYFVGKRLTPDSLSVEQDYLVERRRMLNRAIHGWGVVYGYSVAVKAADSGSSGGSGGLLEIGAGLALDQMGRELVQTESTSVAWADVAVLDTSGVPVKDPASYASTKAAGSGQDCANTPASADCWLLSVHYAEEPIGPVTLNDPCSCDRHQWDQVCETVRYSLVRIDCAKCCAEHPCELECCCATGRCCDPPRVVYKDQQTDSDHWERTHKAPRGGCRCLCDHLTNLKIGADCSALRADEHGVRVDWHNGIALACVSLRQNECKEWEFECIDESCGPRRLVKRNDLLFDLIRGCDLTRISAISWASWHRARNPVPWSEFGAFFGKEYPPGEGHTKFWVTFSRPVRRSTVSTDCFAITVVIPEDEGGWGNVMRVPIVDVVDSTSAGDPKAYVDAEDGSDPPEYMRRAKLVVDAAWAADAIHGRKTQFIHHETTVEIEIRGDYILDCNGQPVDANAYGRVPAPTGNGTPGGTFVSTFRLQEKVSLPAGKTSAS